MIRKISPVKFEHYKQLRRLTEGHQGIDIHTARELTSNMSRTLYSKTKIGNILLQYRKFIATTKATFTFLFYNDIEGNGFQFLDHPNFESRINVI